MDSLLEDVPLPGDIKSTLDAREASFSEGSFDDYGYYRQAPFYLDGLVELGFEVDDDHFAFVAVEEDGAHDLSVWYADPDDVAVGPVGEPRRAPLARRVPLRLGQVSRVRRGHPKDQPPRVAAKESVMSNQIVKADGGMVAREGFGNRELERRAEMGIAAGRGAGQGEEIEARYIVSRACARATGTSCARSCSRTAERPGFAPPRVLFDPTQGREAGAL